MYHFMKQILLVVLVISGLTSCRNEIIRTSDEPRQDLSPMEVVVSQLVALQTNDEPNPDHGVNVAFAFASPKNKDNTGPFDKFKAMLHSDPYLPLIDHRKYKVSEHFINGREAQFFVEIISRENEVIKYIFELSLVKESPFTDFWMTEAVIPIRNKLINPHNNTINV